MTWKMDAELLRKLRKKKERERRAADQPSPSLADCEVAFQRRFVRAAINAALQRLTPDDRELLDVLYPLDPEEPRSSIAQLAVRRQCDRSTLYRRVTQILLELREIVRENG